MWFAVGGLWFVVCGLWFVVFGLWFVVESLWFGHAPAAEARGVEVCKGVTSATDLRGQGLENAGE